MNIEERRNSIGSTSTDSPDEFNHVPDPEDSEDLFKPRSNDDESLPRALNPSTSLSPRPETLSPGPVPPPPLTVNSSPAAKETEERFHRRAALFRDSKPVASSTRIHLHEHHANVGREPTGSSSPSRLDSGSAAAGGVHPSQSLAHDHSGCPACTAAAAAAAHHHRQFYDYYDPYHLPHHQAAVQPPSPSPSSHYYPPLPHTRMYSPYGYPTMKPEPVIGAPYADHHFHQHHHYHQHTTTPSASSSSESIPFGLKKPIGYYHPDELDDDDMSGGRDGPEIPEALSGLGLSSAIKKENRIKSGAIGKKTVRIKVDSSAESPSVSPAKLSPTAVRRKRSAELSELTFEGYLAGDKAGMERFVRKWRNSRNLVFYDCSCGRRKAVHDLKKIKTHVERIHLGVNATEPMLDDNHIITVTSADSHHHHPAPIVSTDQNSEDDELAEINALERASSSTLLAAE